MLNSLVCGLLRIMLAEARLIHAGCEFSVYKWQRGVDDSRKPASLPASTAISQRRDGKTARPRAR